MSHGYLSFGLVLGAVVAACAGGHENTAPTTPPATEAALHAVLPQHVGSLPSTELRLAHDMDAQLAALARGEAGSFVTPGSEPRAGDELADVDACEACHADAATAWRTSAHAFASFNNPIYRSVVDSFREARPHAKSHFCGGCHDLALLVDNAMLPEVEAKDPRTFAGVSCKVCHGIRNVRPDGNGSYDFELDEIPLPKDGDAASLALHKARTKTSAHATSTLCVGCHRAFLDDGSGNDARFLIGQDDATPYYRSAYAGNLSARVDEDLPAQSCQDCHMPKEAAPLGDVAAKNGKLASHRFLGGHTWLASMRGDRDTLARIETLLRDAVSMRLAAVKKNQAEAVPLGNEIVEVVAGDQITLDVVVKNEKVGHRFPGGVMDADDTWLEVVVTDANGKRVGDSGTRHEATGDIRDPSKPAGTDDEAHAFTSYMADLQGVRRVKRDTQDFAANVFNHTIEARQAAVVRYGFEVPVGLRLPLRVTAKLRYRPRILPVQKVACESTKNERGKAFGAYGMKKVDKNLDPCAPQPVTLIAEDSVQLGVVPAKSEAQSFATAFAHGQGLLRSLQEYVGDARPVFERALALASTDRQRGMALWGLTAVAAREGSLEGTFALADRAEAFVPGHPALARLRAQVKLAHWQWDEAAEWLARSVKASPQVGGAITDDSLIAEWTVALGGAGRSAAALSAAGMALGIQPRDPDCLRVQAMSLRSLQAPVDLLGPAEEAYLHTRTPDDAPKVRGKCSANVPGCARERNPVHVHWLR